MCSKSTNGCILRSITGLETPAMPAQKLDALVVGAGFAGLYLCVIQFRR